MMHPMERPFLLAPATAAPIGWMWLLPRLAFVLFVATVSALLWLSHRADLAEQRATLISDMLWLEHNLTFQLTRNEELLGLIRTDQTRSSLAFEPHARTLLANDTGLRRLLWLDAAGMPRQVFPSAADVYTRDGKEQVLPATEAFRVARSGGKPAYSAPYPVEQNDWQFEVHVPVFRDNRVVGIAVGVYSIQSLLAKSVPWWLAQRYRIAVVDPSGKELVASSKITTKEPEPGYQLSFDPPGHGIALQATAYLPPAPIVGRLSGIALLALAATVLWSLWALRRHAQLRLVAETALRDEYAFRKAMEDSLQTGLRARDLEGRITYVNPAFCRMVGWAAEELVGRKPPMPYWAEEEFDSTREIHDRILAGDGPEEGFEIRFKRRSGEIFDALIHEAPLIDAAGNHAGWMGSLIDITDRKRVEARERVQQEQLQSAARLIAMGEMASSLAHELNQPLAAIASYNTGCLNLLESGQEDPEGLRQALTRSNQQAQRAGRIIRRIYEFVRRSEPKAEACEIHRLIAETLALIETDARHQGIRLLREAGKELPPIQGDRVLLGQVLLNVFRNGMEAMRDTPTAERLLLVTCELQEDQVHVAVADRGAGISPEVAARLFEPFFTTKVEGMGMGLNICRSVIESHRGRLWFEANPQGGSIFHILLPATGT